MLLKSGNRLRQSGFLYVGSFSSKEQAQARAKLHKENGCEAEVWNTSVWIKEANHGKRI